MQQLLLLQLARLQLAAVKGHKVGCRCRSS
jgi:hypothetical protein